MRNIKQGHAIFLKTPVNLYLLGFHAFKDNLLYIMRNDKFNFEIHKIVTSRDI